MAFRFEGVWCDVLGWLREDPDARAVELLDHLQSTHPDRFRRAHLRTLQQLRGFMASKLVYARTNETPPDEYAMPELALIGSDPES